MKRPTLPLALVLALTSAVLAAPAQGASLTISPASPSPGVDVVVRGDGMGKRAHGRVTLAGSDRASFRANRRGHFTAKLTVPAGASTGRRTLAARAGRRRLKARVRVVGAVRNPSTLVVATGGLRLLLSPDRGPAGGAVRLTGAGFPRRARVTARLGSAGLGRARAKRSGSVSLRGRVPSGSPGRKTLLVKAKRIRVRLPFRVLSAAAATPPAIAAAGDIACDPADPNFNGGAGTPRHCQQRATSDAILGAGVSAVLPLGDLQYPNGSAGGFAASYGPTWGRLNSLAHPAVGNREYETPGAGPYYGYFGPRAGTAGQGYYSYSLGSWHLIALNSNCEFVACSAGSPQERWLKADLAAHRTGCTLAYWHHPRRSSGNGAHDEDVSALFNDLYAARTDLLLVGHSHIYERYAPFAPNDQVEPTRGVREFIVGTGGEDQSGLNPPLPGVEARSNTSFGFLRLVLRPTGYDWRFVPAAGGTFADSGSGACR